MVEIFNKRKRKRYRVAPREPEGHFRLTDRDKKIIRLVNRYFLVRTPHIYEHVGARGESLQRSIRNRLTKLHRNHYLTKPIGQFFRYEKDGSIDSIYGLATKGVEFCRTDGNFKWNEGVFNELPDWDWSRINQTIMRTDIEILLRNTDLDFGISNGPIESASDKYGRHRILPVRGTIKENKKIIPIKIFFDFGTIPVRRSVASTSDSIEKRCTRLVHELEVNKHTVVIHVVNARRYKKNIAKRVSNLCRYFGESLPDHLLERFLIVESYSIGASSTLRDKFFLNGRASRVGAI